MRIESPTRLHIIKSHSLSDVNTFRAQPIFGYFPFRPRETYFIDNFASELIFLMAVKTIIVKKSVYNKFHFKVSFEQTIFQ